MTRHGMDETHDASRCSWVQGSAGGDFPVQNLPYCTFNQHGSPQVGVGIGDAVLDLKAAQAADLFDSTISDALADISEVGLRALMEWQPSLLTQLRQQLCDMLTSGSTAKATAEECLLPRSTLGFEIPVRPPCFTDFFASIFHARNAGELRRPGQPLLPNFHHLPVAYNGRSSTVRVSGTNVNRPAGQLTSKDQTSPVFAATSMLDFECELAVWVRGETHIGQRVGLHDAPSHVFGIGLLNDWSARDIQLWESQPLGPLLSKSFLTTVSPWIVTADALIPFRRPASERPSDAPPLLPYLQGDWDSQYGGLNIRLQVAIESAVMRERAIKPFVVATPQFKDHYWTVAQMLTHLTSNGCCIEPGDLVGTGTVSGPSCDELGCLLELTSLGKKPFHLPTGESRTWLEDGDEVVIRGICEAPGFVSIGFGEARGRVLPAIN